MPEYQGSCKTMVIPSWKSFFSIFPGFRSQLDCLCASSHLYRSVTLPSAAETNKQACQEERIGKGVKLLARNEETCCPW